jgi:hypothetical protein
MSAEGEWNYSTCLEKCASKAGFTKLRAGYSSWGEYPARLGASGCDFGVGGGRHGAIVVSVVVVAIG